MTCIVTQQQFSTVKSRTYRDNKILRNLFSTFAVLWLTKQAVYVRYKTYRTYGGLVLPKWMVCKSKWQTKPLCMILLTTVSRSNRTRHSDVVFSAIPTISNKPRRIQGRFWVLFSCKFEVLTELNCCHSFWSRVSRTFVCFRCSTSELSTWLECFR